MQAFTEEEAQERAIQYQDTFGPGLKDLAAFLGDLVTVDPLGTRWFIYHLNYICKEILKKAERLEQGTVH